ncbi:MAG: hypothetical protein Q9185_005899 [Variospora sp. 1 TL-2023]
MAEKKTMAQQQQQPQGHETRLTRAQSKAQSNLSKPTIHLPPPESLSPTAPQPAAPVPPLPKKRTPRPRPAKKPAKPFPFLSLPVETRVQIYHDALTYTHILIRKPNAAKARKAGTPLLLLNRLVYAEAFPIFHDVNVFQVHIGGLPSDTETQIANVHYMRQCCLHLEILDYQSGSKSSLITKLMNKFVADIWSGKMECLLIEVWKPNDWSGGTSYLEKCTWVSGIHLAQVVINQVGENGEVMRIQDRWCQQLERSMMKPRSWVAELGVEYEAEPQLGIHLVGEELERARKSGGWVVEDNDLYALFGKC